MTRANHYHLYLLKRAKERFALFYKKKLAIGTQKTKRISNPGYPLSRFLLIFPIIPLFFSVYLSIHVPLSIYLFCLFYLSVSPFTFVYHPLPLPLFIYISFPLLYTYPRSSFFYLFLLSSPVYQSFSSFDYLFLPFLFIYPSFLFCLSIPSSSSVYVSIFSLLYIYPFFLFCLFISLISSVYLPDCFLSVPSASHTVKNSLQNKLISNYFSYL